MQRHSKTKKQIKYLVNKGYKLEDLIFMKSKDVNNLYVREFKLEPQLIEELTVDEIFDRDSAALRAA